MNLLKHRFNKIINYIKYLSMGNCKRDPNIWIMGEWFGDRTGDNVTVFANYIAMHFPEINVYWVSNTPEEVRKEYNENIKIIDRKKDNSKLFKASAVAVMNQSYEDLSEQGTNFWKNAITLNLWHGVMWKKIGFDTYPKRKFIGKLYRDIRNSSFCSMLYESTSERYSKCIKTAFDITDNNIIKAGLPRNNIFYSKEQIENSKEKILSLLGIQEANNIKIITYMPTFRDNNKSLFSFDMLADNIDFMKYLDENNIIIIQKTHYVSQQRNNGEKILVKSNRIFNLPNVRAQDLLAATDLLVTDYSSCFFDYLLLNRPIIHYMYDYDTYKDFDKGFYYDYKDVVAGDIAYNQDELVNSIIANIENPNKMQNIRNKRKNEFLTYESPESCKIISQAVFDKIKENFEGRI